MYDVKIEIPPMIGESLEEMNWVHVDFHVAYFSIEYTTQQLIIKLAFSWISFGVFITYCVQVGGIAYKTRTVNWMDFPFETLCTWALLAGLINFNDPWYFIHYKNPNFWTYVIAEFNTALFVAGLMIFWLRDIARHRNKELEQNANKLQKFFHESMGYNWLSMTALVIFYIALVVDFTALYSMFYWDVKSNPGDGEISLNQHQPEKMKPYLLATMIIIGLYYFWFFVSVCRNMVNLRKLDGSTRMFFAFSQGMHAIFILGLLSGIFSRHFEDGGVQVFFYALCNIYIWAMAYVSWPQEVVFKEYNIEETMQSLDHEDVTRFEAP